MSLETKQRYFDRCVRDWAAADKECGRLYALWNTACAKRERLARAKRDAWREIAREATTFSNGNSQ